VIEIVRMPRAKPTPPAVAKARRTLLEGVGVEVAASFPGITRLGGQIVAALYLADGARSMDDLSLELGRSKSNIFANLRGLEAAGIVERSRSPGARHDSYALRGNYPDVIIGAYIGRLRRVVGDKRALCRRASDMLGDAEGPEADALRDRLTRLTEKYERFGILFEEVLPGVDGPLDLAAMLDGLPVSVLRVMAKVARGALGLRAAPRGQAVAVISTRKSLRPMNR
jgi:HTH-type transcriptional regulator, osmoprotectant uptake regulator